MVFIIQAMCAQTITKRNQQNKKNQIVPQGNVVPKLPSISIFFPFYNDAGTVERQITNAYLVAPKFAEKIEVIAIHGGNSRDDTLREIKKLKKRYPDLKIIDKSDNTEGYAVIKHGFIASTSDWIFYTDGDAQYHLEEDLEKLIVTQLKTKADIVNGYKSQRNDSFLRVLLGKLYARASKYLFEIPIRDTDCDFRLIRKSLLSKIELTAQNASILPELIKKLEIAGATFVEVPVSHYSREYGVSNYTPFQLFKEKLIGDIKLYFKLRQFRPIYEKLRIIRFGLVGIVSVVFQFSLFNIFVLRASLQPHVAVFVADQISIFLAFFLTNYFTFSETGYEFGTSLFKSFIKYYAVVTVSTIIQTFFVFTGTKAFGTTLLTSNVFWFIGLIFAFLWNYVIQSRIIWSKYANK